MNLKCRVVEQVRDVCPKWRLGCGDRRSCRSWLAGSVGLVGGVRTSLPLQRTAWAEDDGDGPRISLARSGPRCPLCIVSLLRARSRRGAVLKNNGTCPCCPDRWWSRGRAGGPSCGSLFFFVNPSPSGSSKPQAGRATRSSTRKQCGFAKFGLGSKRRMRWASCT